MTHQTLKRSEMLKSSKWLDAVFEKGNRSKAGPFLMLALEMKESSENPILAAFTVSKKKFRRAHDRNRVKRLMREAYRLNKQLLHENWDERSTGLALVFVYFGNELPTQSEANQKIKKLLERFSKPQNDTVNP